MQQDLEQRQVNGDAAADTSPTWACGLFQQARSHFLSYAEQWRNGNNLDGSKRWIIRLQSPVKAANVSFKQSKLNNQAEATGESKRTV